MASPRKVMACILRLYLLLTAEKVGSAASTSANGNEMWGYVEVRPKAHLFWWLYKSPQRVNSPGKPWPTVLWLQGGPGGSGVGGGNFMGVGPLDVNLKPRNSTWLQKADLIFVDLPVGAGFSYVDDVSGLATTDLQVAADATELLKVLTKEVPTLQSSPLYLVGESYGGKLATMIGVSVARAIQAGTLKLTLGGVVLGNSWISPEDFALSYANLLHYVSRVNDNAVGPLNRVAATVKEHMAAGHFVLAQTAWTELFKIIDAESGAVNIENFMLDTGSNPLSEDSSTSQAFGSASNTIDDIMNGVIKQKLKIIPKDIIWQAASIQVYNAMSAVFMKPAINEVDKLLSYGVNVTVYNGQLDLICPTIGVEAWVKKLKWDGLKNFLSLPRQPLRYCDSSVHCSRVIKAYVRSYQNLRFYWILRAGHSVPVDRPDVALEMISTITQSPGN